ncbi:MAG: redoxin domain-containing protein [Hyphomicrobiaceae bacterium]|nr:redoxin domain-containing protein [Hyphomicrobiaceae bacterium]
MSILNSILPGDPAPWFHQRCGNDPGFAFDTAAGRYIVLCFFASAADFQGREAVDAVRARRDLFDDVNASFFGVSMDPKDESEGRVANSIPGLRIFWDFDGRVAKLYGTIRKDAAPRKGKTLVHRQWFVISPTLRVMKVVPFAPDGSDASITLDYVEALPTPSSFAGFELQAPVLVLPDVLEDDLCSRLIELHGADDRERSGIVRDVHGRTGPARVRDHKPGKDYVIEDEDVIRSIQSRFNRRIVPEIRRAHQFAATRMEHYFVACYAAEDRGHFRPHRDDATKETAHRRFAVSVNLNGDFDGGELCFPEYGPKRFRAPPGGAVVYSCSLLHTVTMVTRGRRYAFLPFLFDDAAAKIRDRNAKALADEPGQHCAPEE